MTSDALVALIAVLVSAATAFAVGAAIGAAMGRLGVVELDDPAVDASTMKRPARRDEAA